MVAPRLHEFPPGATHEQALAQVGYERVFAMELDRSRESFHLFQFRRYPCHYSEAPVGLLTLDVPVKFRAAGEFGH
jgi:hypothetical protein